MAQPAGPKIVRIGGDFSYSDIATRRMFGGSADAHVLQSLGACLEEVSARKADVAMVPVHNTENGDIRGAGGVPLADMARSMGLRVLATLELPVDHVLASFGRLEEIKIVYSKDVALGQCSRWIKDHGIKPASAVPGRPGSLDTATAAKYAAEKRLHFIGAICSEDAAEHYGVPIVQRNIANSPDNTTTFHAYVRADSSVPAPGPRGRGGAGPARGPPAGAAASASAAPHGQPRARDPRMVDSPQHLPAPPMAAQATAESPLGRAAIGTKRYIASIAADPRACPMFPYIDEDNGTGEALCYFHGYLAGLVAASGQRPTKAEMGELVQDALSGPGLRDIIRKVQADVRPFDGICPPSEL